MKHTFKLPLEIPVTKAGRMYKLNMNIYTRTHRNALNNYKKIYTYLLKDKMEASPKFTGAVKITYVVYGKQISPFDVDNLTSVQRKFFQDALVEHGVIIEDNYKYIESIEDKFGGIDIDDPRIEATIEAVSNSYTDEDLDNYIKGRIEAYREDLISKGNTIVTNKIINIYNGESKSTKGHYAKALSVDVKNIDIKRHDRDHKLITIKF